MLINCVVYQNGSKLADIPVDEISKCISRPNTFVWVALQNATTVEVGLKPPVKGTQRTKFTA